METQGVTTPEFKASAEWKPASAPAEAKVAEELARIPHEPFLPIERKLVTWSLALGALLLVGLVWISSAFFPG